ncbi:MAG: hypothetical protein M0Z31_12150 [Clostridia bacterium]|nr:hypothetical protein [Clostridia bacterium]
MNKKLINEILNSIGLEKIKPELSIPLRGNKPLNSAKTLNAAKK